MRIYLQEHGYLTSGYITEEMVSPFSISRLYVSLCVCVEAGVSMTAVDRPGLMWVTTASGIPGMQQPYHAWKSTSHMSPHLPSDSSILSTLSSMSFLNLGGGRIGFPFMTGHSVIIHFQCFG